MRRDLQKRFPDAQADTISAAVSRSGGYLGQAIKLLEGVDALPQQTLDFAEAFADLQDSGMGAEAGKNEHGEPMYAVTEKGRCVCQELGKSRTPIVLEHALAAALRFLDFRKRGVSIKSRIEEAGDGRFWFICTMWEKGVVIMEDKILVDSIARARQMEENFSKRPEAIYRGTFALLAGNVNYLL